MEISPTFHNAVITSIASYAREESINIYDLIRTLIADLTHIISGSGRNAWRQGIRNEHMMHTTKGWKAF